MAGKRKAAELLFITTADTEILAAAKATELLLSRIRQPGRPTERVLLQPRLKIRSAGAMQFETAAAQ